MTGDGLVRQALADEIGDLTFSFGQSRRRTGAERRGRRQLLVEGVGNGRVETELFTSAVGRSEGAVPEFLPYRRVK